MRGNGNGGGSGGGGGGRGGRNRDEQQQTVFESQAGPEEFLFNTETSDTLVLDSVADAPATGDVTQGGRETIRNFASGDSQGAPDDIIDLSAIDANVNTAEDDAFVLIGDADFSGTAGELQVLFFPTSNGETTGVSSALISGDVDGDGVADFEILVANTRTGLDLLEAAPDADNFIL